MFRRVVWTAIGAVLLLLAAIAVAILLPEQDTLALVLVGSSISLSVLSHREA